MTKSVAIPLLHVYRSRDGGHDASSGFTYWSQDSTIGLKRVTHGNMVGPPEIRLKLRNISPGDVSTVPLTNLTSIPEFERDRSTRPSYPRDPSDFSTPLPSMVEVRPFHRNVGPDSRFLLPNKLPVTQVLPYPSPVSLRSCSRQVPVGAPRMVL